MKKQHQNPVTATIPQSEAMLAAMKASFFEVYFEKRKIKNLLAISGGQRLRLRLAGLRNGKYSFTAEILDRLGKKSKQATFDATTTECKHPSAFLSFWKKCKAEFSRRDLSRMISSDHCTGLRFMPGILPSRRRAILVSGVKPGGFDFSEGYLASW